MRGSAEWHETVDLDQVERALGMFPGRQKSASQARGRQQAEKARPADVGRRFGHEQGAVGAGLLLHAAADHERVGAVRAGIAARAKRQAGNDPRRIIVLRQEMTPPRIGVALLRHRQDADRGMAFGDGADHLADRAIGRHRRMAAVMIARQIPKTRRLGAAQKPRPRTGFRAARSPPAFRARCAPPSRPAARRVARSEPAHDLRLARRLVRGDIVAFLAGRDPRHDFRPLDQQIVHPVVDRIDVAA